jgi:hypothetical protein
MVILEMSRRAPRKDLKWGCAQDLPRSRLSGANATMLQALDAAETPRLVLGLGSECGLGSEYNLGVRV